MSISLNIGNKAGINPVQNSIVTSKISPNFRELQKDTVDIKENAADKILRENREHNEGKYNKSSSSKHLNIAAFPAIATVLGSYIYGINKIIKSIIFFIIIWSSSIIFIIACFGLLLNMRSITRAIILAT